MKKRILIVSSAIIVLILFGCISGSFHYNVKSRNVLVFQFGQIVNVQKNPGVYFTIPVIQSTESIFMGERLYDLPTTAVTTSDKKQMIANCYVTWKITDAKLYFQKLSTESDAQERLRNAVYGAMKNVISSKSQDEVISGKDGSLGPVVKDKIKSLGENGIEVTQIEIKILDLPEDNKASVYQRMISERNAIAAEYKANGDKEAATIMSRTDSQKRTIVSNAEAEAADIVAEGERQYYEILAEAYSQSYDRTEFYKFMMELDALKEALKNGGTVVVDENSWIYDLLNNSNFTSDTYNSGTVINPVSEEDE